MDFPDFRSWLSELEELIGRPRPQPNFYCGHCHRWAQSGHECVSPQVALNPPKLPDPNWDEPLPRRFREDR